MKKQMCETLPFAPFEVWYENGEVAYLPTLFSFMREVLTNDENSLFYVKVFDVKNYPDEILSNYNSFDWFKFFDNVEKCECIYFNNSVEYGNEPLWIDEDKGEN